jgi:SAM-dependent methyltransferase
MLALRHEDTVLDVGCGTGGAAFYLARTLGCFVYGIDLSVNMILAALEDAAANSTGHKVMTWQRATWFAIVHCCWGFFLGVLVLNTVDSPSSACRTDFAHIRVQNYGCAMCQPVPFLSMQVSLEVSDCTKRDFPDASFDAVYSCDTLLHVHDKPALFFRWVCDRGWVGDGFAVM